MRQNCGFPGLAIQWGFVGDTGVLIDNFGKRDKGMGGLLPQRMYCCLQTMDLFLQQPYPVLSSMVLDDEHSTVQAGSVSLITCVLKILGVRDIKKVHDSTTLVEVGMDSLMCTEIKQSLERNYDIIMSAQEIRRLTLGELKKLSHGIEDNEAAKRITPEHGTARALNVFGDEPTGTYSRELMPALPILRLPSAAPEDCSQRPLFLVSPIDGFVDSLRALALRLDCPVYGLQSSSEANLDSIDSLASFYLKHMLAVQPKGPYTIAGYSFGALVAFVIALQLEKSNEEVSLVMLDGAPKYVNSYVTSFKQRLATSDHQKEAHGLAYFSMIVANADFNVVANLLLSIPTWENKLDKCTEIIAKEINQPVHLVSRNCIP